MAFSDRGRGNGHKLTYGRFPLNIRKHFFIVQLSEHLYRLPRKLGGKRFGAGSLAILEQGFDPEDTQMSLSTSTTL